MWWNNLWSVLFVMSIGSLLAYILIDRVCKCVEACSIAKTYGEVIKQNPGIKKEDFALKIKQ